MFIWCLMKYLHKTLALIIFLFHPLKCSFKREFFLSLFFPLQLMKEWYAYCAGVARGCGWQHLAVYANLGTFYCIGMPIAILLGFKLKLYAKVLISILRPHTLLNRYYFLLVVLLTGFLLSVLCFLTGLVVGSNLRPLLPGRHPFVAHTALKMDSYGAIWKHQLREPCYSLIVYTVCPVEIKK